MHPLTAPLSQIPLCVVDIETTGASFDYGDRVVELGIVRLEAGQITATYDKLIDPGRPMSGGAAAITGITRDMLEGQPRFCDVWADACSVLSGSIVVGHNVGFDLSFLAGECRRGGPAICEALGDLPILDTVRLARKQFGRGGNGLQRLAARLNLPQRDAHRALADCHTTADLLHVLLAPHGGWDMTLARACELQGGYASLGGLKPSQSPLPTEIAEALYDRVPVRISYLDAGNRRTDRAVTPKFVRRVNGNLMLFAHCHLKDDQRCFKVDRILDAAPMSDLTPVVEAH
ncbi:MAG TPA: exonuclease domain-containing protein [Tepidisphaeraceae bacterium]|jgi:DNA polymerase III epsilon subunit family exonuclease